MRPGKIPNFSEPYSKSNKKLMAHFSKCLQLNHKSQKKSPRPARESRSANTSISNIPETEILKKKAKLALGEDRMEKIKYSLEVEETSKRNYQKRVKENELYLKYQDKPLSSRERRKDPLKVKKKINYDQNYDKLSNKEISQALNLLREKNILQEIKMRVDRLESQGNDVFGRMKSNLLQQKKQIQIIEQQHQASLELAPYVISLLDSSAFDELDQIVMIKEENFFVRKWEKEKPNIFKFMKNSQDRAFMSGKEQLNQHLFAFETIQGVSNNKRFNEEICRSLSTYSRISAINGNSPSIPRDFKLHDQEINMDPYSLNFFNLMIIARGFVSPSVLLRVREKAEKGLMDKEDNSLIEITNAIHFKDNTKQMGMNCADNLADKTQDEYYKKVSMTYQQNLELGLSQERVKKLEEVLSAQMKCRKKMINDRSLHRYFQNLKDQLLGEQLKQKGRVIDLGEMQRKIRASKFKKDKKQIIQIQSIFQSLLKKKQFQSKLDSRSKSKTRRTLTRA